MKRAYLSAAALAACVLATGAQAAPAVTGEYVESRSANVYVGACHHEGEIGTAGRNALLAWNVTGGEFQGVSLKGVAAVAVVSADKNLSLNEARRRAVLYVSDQASADQKTALVALLKERAPGALGELVAVRTAPIRFETKKDTFRVEVADAASMSVRKQVAKLCCKQPYEVWGKPFVPVRNFTPGFTVGVEFRDASLLQSWKAADQNSAFYGQFSL